MNGKELVLFNNKEILIENQTIFYEDWFQKEIFLIHDLLKTMAIFLLIQKRDFDKVGLLACLLLWKTFSSDIIIVLE